MTAAGTIRPGRWRTRCRACAEVGFPSGERLGLDGVLTRRARRMACLAGVNDPFREAETLLREWSGWAVDADTIRRRTHAEAASATRTRADREQLPAAFAEAQRAAVPPEEPPPQATPATATPGEAGVPKPVGKSAVPRDPEVRIDAGKVTALDGGRDVTVAVLAVRERGTACSSAEIDTRVLPPPAVRSAIAAAEEVGLFAPRCRAEAARLGLTDPARSRVPGDGAEWVWNLADERFAGAKQVRDFDHAAEYLASAGRASLEGSAFEDWLERATGPLLADGSAGACEALHELAGGAAEVGSALNDLAGHRDRRGYAARLRRGQSIGRGLVEGTIEQRVNLRRKRTGARWRAEHAGPLVEFLALSDTPEWAEYWNAA